MPITSSSQDPVGGLNSALALAGGVVSAGWLFRPFFAVPPLVPTLDLPRLRPLVSETDAFFSSHSASMASFPPTLERYAVRTSGAVSLEIH